VPFLRALAVKVHRESTFPRSAVNPSNEIHDLLRFLCAGGGISYGPEHDDNLPVRHATFCAPS